MSRRSQGAAAVVEDDSDYDEEQFKSASEDERRPSPAKRSRQSNGKAVSASPAQGSSKGKRKGSPPAKRAVSIASDSDAAQVVESGDELQSEGDDDDEEADYVVKKILGHRDVGKGNFEYLIRWEGYGSDDDTWEPEANCNADALIKAYWKSVPTKKQPRKRAQVEKRHDPKQDTQMDEGSDESSIEASTPKRPSSQRSAARESAKKRRRVSRSVETDEANGDDDSAAEAEAEAAAPRLKDHKKFRAYIKRDDWEKYVTRIVTVQRMPESDLEVLIKFRDGVSFYCPKHIVYEKCPQLMLKFYEERVRFRTPVAEAGSMEEDE